MLTDRKADSSTEVITSVNWVLRNKGSMLVWDALVGTPVILGFGTGLTGFVVLLPVLGHASWHAYRQTIDESAWKQHKIC